MGINAVDMGPLHFMNLCLIPFSEVISLVDAQITSRSYGRLFAAVYFDGEQRKFSVGDLIMVNKDIAIDVGQQITLDKVTLVGGKDFTLIGRPVLPRDLVRVEATVVEKNLSRTNVLLICKKKPSRGQYKCKHWRVACLTCNACWHHFNSSLGKHNRPGTYLRGYTSGTPETRESTPMPHESSVNARLL
jgi:large subunit ribosomal protein L21